jgi:3-dehydroquinate synthase
MLHIESTGYFVHVGPIGHTGLQAMLLQQEYKHAKLFILVDENTLQHCLPYLLSEVEALQKAEVIEIESGESQKNIEICTRIWEALSEMEADRDAVIINLGGGVICDMGGFISGAYKRGIRFIHIPTTLLSQVDASVGGKVGVDLNGLKNQIGLFAKPQAVFIDSQFLQSLSVREILSGFAEIIKHGLIADANYWELIQEQTPGDVNDWDELIRTSVAIKNKIVTEDPTEKGLRKVLNFGHTIGHAVESLSMENGRKPLLHGEAIAIGMICEAWLSHRFKKLPEKDLRDITELISAWYAPYSFDDMDFHRLIELMRNDKKNKEGKINFTLLDGIGQPVFDCYCSPMDIKEALRYYLISRNHDA